MTKQNPAPILGYEGNIPIVGCSAVLRPQSAARPKGPKYWSLQFVCPFCGRQHRHGGGDGETPDGGHRVAHCFPSDLAPSTGYILEVKRID